MNTKNNKAQAKKENQLVFIEYEKPTKEGHFMTIMDSYRNVIGRVNKSFNEQSKKFEYAAFDHAGKPFSNGEKLWEVKNEFINNRDVLLEQAHQRRIESKEKSKENDDKEQPPKSDERIAHMEKLREGKTERELVNEKPGRDENDENQQNERNQELDDIRNDEDDERGDMDIEY